MRVAHIQVVSRIDRAAARTRLINAMAVELWRLHGQVGTAICGEVSRRADFRMPAHSKLRTPQQSCELPDAEC